MDSADSSTKRPLLEDEVPADVPLPSAERGTSQRPSRAAAAESCGLLEDGAAEEEASTSAGLAGSPVVASQTHRGCAGGGLLHFVAGDEADGNNARNSPETPSVVARRQLLHDEHPTEPASPKESVVIEMRNISEEMDKSREPLPVVSSVASSALRQGDDRNCFICLQDGDKDNPLISCCSTCFARTHIRCWREWRSNQHRTALRSHLLGLRMQTNHMLRCTICKSGTALVEGEENGLSWMNELMCGGEPREGSLLARLAAVGTRREDSDEDPEAQLEDLIDTRTCAALVIYLGLLVVVVIIACLLIVTQRFWAGDVVLCCIIALYQLSVLQLVLLAVLRRRGAVLAAASPRRENGTVTTAESNVREIQLQTF